MKRSSRRAVNQQGQNREGTILLNALAERSEKVMWHLYSDIERRRIDQCFIDVISGCSLNLLAYAKYLYTLTFRLESPDLLINIAESICMPAIQLARAEASRGSGKAISELYRNTVWLYTRTAHHLRAGNERNNHVKTALRYLKQARQSNPDDYVVHKNIAYIYKHLLDNSEVASEHFRMAIALAADRNDSQRVIETIRYEQGKRRHAYKRPWLRLNCQPWLESLERISAALSLKLPRCRNTDTATTTSSAYNLTDTDDFPSLAVSKTPPYAAKRPTERSMVSSSSTAQSLPPTIAAVTLARTRSAVTGQEQGSAQYQDYRLCRSQPSQSAAPSRLSGQTSATTASTTSTDSQATQTCSR